MVTFIKINLSLFCQNKTPVTYKKPKYYSIIGLNTDADCYGIVSLAIVSLFKLTKIQSCFCFSFFFLHDSW